MSAFKVDLWRAQIIMLTHEEPASHTRLEHPPSGAGCSGKTKTTLPVAPTLRMGSNLVKDCQPGFPRNRLRKKMHSKIVSQVILCTYYYFSLSVLVV